MMFWAGNRHVAKKVQQPFRNDHTGDWIWCEGTIQYRLREPGDNRGPQIRVVWHRQKELDQGSSAPTSQRDTPWSSSAPTRTRPTEAPNTLGNSPRSGAKASPRRAYPSAHHPAESPRAPVPLPDGARAEGTNLDGPGPPPPRPPSTSSTSTTRPSRTPRTPQPPSRSSRWHRGRGGFRTSSPSRNKA